MPDDLQAELRALRVRMDQLVERLGGLDQARADASEGQGVLVQLIERWTVTQQELKASVDRHHAMDLQVHAEVKAQGKQLERAMAALERTAKAQEVKSNAWSSVLRNPIVQQALSLLLLGVVAWALLRMDVWQLVAP